MITSYFIIFVFLCTKLVNGFTIPKAGCSINITNDFGTDKPSPLILRPGVSYDVISDYPKAFYLPDQDTGLINIKTNENVLLACPGALFTLFNTSEVSVTCSPSNMFYAMGKMIEINKLTCTKEPSHDSQMIDTCGDSAGDNIGVGIGYPVAGKFYPLLYVCYNERTHLAHYSATIISPSILKVQPSKRNNRFVQDSFYPEEINVTDIYKYDNVFQTFAQLLRSEAKATEYLHDRSTTFLSKGHLIANADFSLRAHRAATYHYINAAPQWQVFNGGVWSELENSIRQFASSAEIFLNVYTGTLGTLSYADNYGYMTDIYLDLEEMLPVPKFFWKIVYEPIERRGIAFIGINDPYVNSVSNTKQTMPYPDDYVICSDIGIENITWLKISDPKWLYACDVRELTQLSPLTLPHLIISEFLVD